MTKLIVNSKLAFSVGLLLVIPSAYFITSALLNYGFGFSSLWKLIEPIFEKPGNKHPGFNINLLIVFGPFGALLINLPQVISLHIINETEDVNIRCAVKKYSWNWIVIVAGILCISCISLYVMFENCNC